MTARILIAIPVLRRPHRARPVVESIRAATPPGSYRVLFVGSPGDDAEHKACRSTGEALMIIDEPHGPGDYQRKINAAHRASTEPLMLLGADDVEFRPGWLEAVERVVAGGAHVVGTMDLGSPRVLAGEHGTHCVVTREYVERFGTIDEPGKVMHEGYVHEFSDDELVETAKYRGVWGFAADAVIEHLHPSWGKADPDELYRDQTRRMNESRPLFRARRSLWGVAS